MITNPYILARLGAEHRRDMLEYAARHNLAAAARRERKERDARLRSAPGVSNALGSLGARIARIATKHHSPAVTRRIAMARREPAKPSG